MTERILHRNADPAVTRGNSADPFQAALALHQRGELDRARAGYEQILATEPRHVGALQLLGILSGQTGQFARALELLSRAIEIDPNNAVAHCNRASALKELGRLEPALAAYDRAIALKADYAEAHAKRGVALAAMRQFDAAIAGYTRAIALKPNYAEPRFNLGNALQALGRSAEALAAYTQVIALNPQHAAAHFNRGNVLRALGQREAALASFERAVALQPALAGAHANRGVVLTELRRFEAALESFARAIAIDPNHAEHYINRAKALVECHRLEEALASCDRAIALCPDSAFAHSHRGVVLKELDDRGAARASFDRALAVDPACAEAHANRGVLGFEGGEWSAALADYDRAIELDPDFAKARVNRAMALLLLGDYARGWVDYEWRRKAYPAPSPGQGSGSPARSWLGDGPLTGKTILLQSEQGMGDTIQFCRYAPLLAEAGATVILEVQTPLKPALAGLAGVTRLVTPGEAVPTFDYHCPLMSLPLAFGTTLATIPLQEPYLSVAPDKKRLWGERLGPKTRPRVGLVWSGGFRPDRPDLWAVNRRRNIPLEQLAPLADAGIEYFSLQKGELAERELAELRARAWSGPALSDWTPQLEDFADTAALIAQLDLVISVDTSTAHLSAALGKPVWILNRFDTCWRWLLERSDSPWYPSVRLYRQGHPGDWAGVVERVRVDLARWINSRSSQGGS